MHGVYFGLSKQYMKNNAVININGATQTDVYNKGENVEHEFQDRSVAASPLALRPLPIGLGLGSGFLFRSLVVLVVGASANLCVGGSFRVRWTRVQSVYISFGRKERSYI